MAKLRQLAWFVAIGVIAATDRSAAALPGANGRIGYVRLDSIWTARTDGGGRKWVTSGRCPSWSPDASWILFDRDGEIWKVRRDGKRETRLTRSAATDLCPSMSPHGDQIAWMRIPDGRYSSGLWVMGSDGSNPTQVTQGGVNDDLWPEWFPDGTTLLFERNEYDEDGEFIESLWTVDVASGVERQIPNSVYSTNPDIAPNGSKIVYQDGDDIAIMDLDGQNQQTLTETAENVSDPAFSPNGRRIVYVRWSRNQRQADLYTMRTDGSDVRRVTTTRRPEISPDWGPRRPVT